MAKRLLLIGIYLIFNFQIFSQIELKPFLKKIEIGKCFVSVPQDTSNSFKQFLQIMPATFDTTWVTINEEFLLKHFSLEEINNKETLKLKIKPAYVQIVKKVVNQYCVSNEFIQEFGITLCLEEVLPIYLNLKKIVVLNDNKVQNEIKEELVPILKLQNIGNIKIVNEIEANSSQYSIFPLFESKYGDWKEIIGCGCRRTI